MRVYVSSEQTIALVNHTMCARAILNRPKRYTLGYRSSLSAAAAHEEASCGLLRSAISSFRSMCFGAMLVMISHGSRLLGDGIELLTAAPTKALKPQTANTNAPTIPLQFLN
jgi:hypothetical protein